MAWMERKKRSRRPLTREDLLGIANYLTYARIAAVPLVILALSLINDDNFFKMGWNRFWGWGSMVLFAVAQSSDMVDGYYARRYNITSSFGKFVDPLADKLLSMSILIMLTALHWVAAWIVILLIAREMTITALRSIAATEGIEIAASDWGKKKTVAQSFALGALMVHYPFDHIRPDLIGQILLWITLFISTGSALHYIWAFFREVLEKRKTVKA